MKILWSALLHRATIITTYATGTTPDSQHCLPSSELSACYSSSRVFWSSAWANFSLSMHAVVKNDLRIKHKYFPAQLQCVVNLSPYLFMLGTFDVITNVAMSSASETLLWSSSSSSSSTCICSTCNFTLPLYKCYFIFLLYNCLILFHCLMCICLLWLNLPACKLACALCRWCSNKNILSSLLAHINRKNKVQNN